jgi:lipoprotein-releasing system permease protein
MASKAQTALTVLGVAVGVVIFMSALIRGLAEFILSPTVDDIDHIWAHITIDANTADPPLMIAFDGHMLVVMKQGKARTATRKQAATWLPSIAALAGVRAVQPRTTGAGFLSRSAQISRVSVTGVEPGHESAILDFDGCMVEGEARLGSGAPVPGRTLANDLAPRLGQMLRLQSSGGLSAVLMLSWI